MTHPIDGRDFGDQGIVQHHALSGNDWTEHGRIHEHCSLERFRHDLQRQGRAGAPQAVGDAQLLARETIGEGAGDRGIRGSPGIDAIRAPPDLKVVTVLLAEQQLVRVVQHHGGAGDGGGRGHKSDEEGPANLGIGVGGVEVIEFKQGAQRDRIRI